jgi:hypothetical protein
MTVLITTFYLLSNAYLFCFFYLSNLRRSTSAPSAVLLLVVFCWLYILCHGVNLTLHIVVIVTCACYYSMLLSAMSSLIKHM